MSKLSIIITLLCVQLSFALESEECRGFHRVYVENGVQLRSRNYPRDYPPFIRCGFLLISRRNENLMVQCQVFDVNGGQGSRCFRGKVRTISHNTGERNVYCGKRPGLHLEFSRSIYTRTVTSFRFNSRGRTGQGFLCNVISGNNSTMPPIESSMTTPNSTVSLMATSSSLTSNTTSSGAPTKQTVGPIVTTTKPSTTTQSSNEFRCQCGIKNIRGRIVGGGFVEENEYPWQAGVMSVSSKRPFCGGSLVSDRHVITAAHCIISQDMQVSLGDHNLRDSNDKTVYIRVRTKHVHPQYNRPRNNNDIAVLELEESVMFTRFIQPICLPLDNSDMFVGDSCTISGWGSTSEGGFGSSILKEAQVTVMTNEECRQTYGNTITAQMICAGIPGGGVDSCQGDSGGPMACPQQQKLVLAGVTSFGFGCARPNIPGVYARVTALRSFLDPILASGTTCN